jgi:hypothetical protein
MGGAEATESTAKHESEDTEVGASDTEGTAGPKPRSPTAGVTCSKTFFFVSAVIDSVISLPPTIAVMGNAEATESTAKHESEDTEVGASDTEGTAGPKPRSPTGGVYGSKCGMITGGVDRPLVISKIGISVVSIGVTSSNSKVSILIISVAGSKL